MSTRTDGKGQVTAALIGGIFLVVAATISGVFLVESSRIKEQSSSTATAMSLIVQSPLATYTRLPTYTPLPTYTIPPESSPFPTYTVLPSTATERPHPTIQPSSTPIPQPTQDLRLEVGQTWTQNGVALTLDNAVLTLKSGNWRGHLGLSFVFKNSLSNELFFSVGRHSFFYKDNLGNVADSTGWGWPCYTDTWNVSVPAGGTVRTTDCLHPGTIGNSGELFDRLIWFDVDITNQKLTEITVTVREFSRIADASWRIPVPH
jgi:hypothetical protein